MPGRFYQPVIAAAFGTATHVMFPIPPKRDANEVLAVSGMDTLGLVELQPLNRYHLALGSEPKYCRTSLRAVVTISLYSGKSDGR
jgi:hypothetical protein